MQTLWRYCRLFLAVLLVICAFFVPRSWTLFAGQLSFNGTLHGDAVSGPALPVALISQYQGLGTDNVNCGPASVAAILRYVRPDLLTMDTPSLVAAVRANTGEVTGDTNLPELVRALDEFGVPSALLYAGDAPNSHGDPLAPIQRALALGRPVLATVGGAALGRGSQYGDHFIVITGLDVQAGLVDVVDPDTQKPRNPLWMPGGRQRWSVSLVQTALHGAEETDALALVPSAQRTGVISPLVIFLPPAAGLVILGLLPWRRRRRTARSMPRRL